MAPTRTPPPSLRQRNRLATMRQVQLTAVESFETEGFDAVTVEQIAARAAVSPSTVYRHFGTKEALVLWDERDAAIDRELTDRLGRQPTMEAFRDSIVVALAQREDLELFRRRLRLTYAEPAIWRAAAAADPSHRAELADAFAAVDGRRGADLADEVRAATCLATLDVALERWQRGTSRTSLATLVTDAVDAAVALD